MKFLRSRGLRRRLAGALATLMCAPYLLMGPPARAQATPPPTYILDFNNRTTVGGALLGRVAAAQLALELAESPNWDIIPNAQVQRRIQELTLRQPFDKVDRVRIGNGIDATQVVYGSITDARITGGTTPQAFVRMQVMVEDLGTGVLVNGTVANGASTPRMGFSGDADVLLEEALSKAAFAARQQMDRFRLPNGTVLNTTVVGGGDDIDIDCLLNIGARNGVRRGMEMIVTRQRELVGTIRVTNVDADISTARVLRSAQGVQPEDRVRAIFTFSDFGNYRTSLLAQPEAGPRPVSAATGVGARIAAASKGGDEIRIAKADRGSEFVQLKAATADPGVQVAQDPVRAPDPVVVDEPSPAEQRGEGAGGAARRVLGGGALKMLAGGLLVLGILAIGGRGGENAHRADGTTAAAYQPQIGTPTAAIRVGWDRPKAVNSSRVIQYIIWRASSAGAFQIVGVIQGDAAQRFIDPEAARDVQDVYDATPPNDDAGTQATLTAVPGVVAGQQFRYQVATVYRAGLRDRDGDGVPDDDTQTTPNMSPLSESSQWITALRPPAITEPLQSAQVQSNDIDVTFSQTPGADTYVIWMSDSPSFPKDRRVVFGPFRVIPSDQGGPATVTRNIFARGPLGGARNLYITVGARNSQDPRRPEPFGAVFSQPVSVQVESVPPPPPGAQQVKKGGHNKKGSNRGSGSGNDSRGNGK